jgi:hypothetical protein
MPSHPISNFQKILDNDHVFPVKLIINDNYNAVIERNLFTGVVFSIDGADLSGFLVMSKELTMSSENRGRCYKIIWYPENGSHEVLFESDKKATTAFFQNLNTTLKAKHMASSIRNNENLFSWSNDINSFNNSYLSGEPKQDSTPRKNEGMDKKMVVICSIIFSVMVFLVATSFLSLHGCKLKNSLLMQVGETSQSRAFDSIIKEDYKYGEEVAVKSYSGEEILENNFDPYSVEISNDYSSEGNISNNVVVSEEVILSPQQIAARLNEQIKATVDDNGIPTIPDPNSWLGLSPTSELPIPGGGEGFDSMEGLKEFGLIIE